MDLRHPRLECLPLRLIAALSVSWSLSLNTNDTDPRKHVKIVFNEL